MSKEIKVAILITGDEIMTGKTQDTNSNYICKEFAAIGSYVNQIVSLGDNLNLITETIANLIEHFDILIINGGLGPTSDDFTNLSLANALSEPLEENQLALEQVTAWMKTRYNKTVSKTNLKQAWMPRNAQPIVNNNGSAPGIFYHYKNCRIYCTPGVPKELRLMWTEQIKPQILKEYKISQKTIWQLRTFGVGESKLQEKINSILVSDDYKQKIGFRAIDPYVDFKIYGDQSVNKTVALLYNKIKEHLGGYAISEAEEGLEQICVKLLLKSKLKIAIAESASGGNLSAMITSIPGASKVFIEGTVCYSEEAKMSLLQIERQMLDKYSAVSAEVTAALAKNTRKNSQADIAIAITGYTDSGPSDKLGQFFIAWVGADFELVEEFKFNSERPRMQRQAGYAALDGLRRLLLKIDQAKNYSFDFLVK